MLITCPECQIQVSDKAVMCPHCGFPFKADKISSRKSTKKKRLPNGFGQISFIKGNLRKPYRAMISVGKNENGRPICKLLMPEAYFKTYNDAYAALMEYHRAPVLYSQTITMNQLFEQWLNSHKEELTGANSARRYETMWMYAANIYDKLVRQVHIPDIEYCLLNACKTVNGEIQEATPHIKNDIKIILNQMFDYAVAHEYTDKNYARMYHLPKNITKSMELTEQAHIPFTETELNKLKNNLNLGFSRIMYIQCYSGWRPSELLSIKLSDVDLNKGFITGGMKTESGKNRVVPIHSKISPMIKAQYALAKKTKSEFLFFNKNGGAFTYGQYAYGFDSTIKKLDLNEKHNPHDPRMTFVTLAKKYGVDEYAIKKIVGHKITDITEKVYTKRDLDWLKNEMEKIK